jgi:hypothetical protein
MIMAKLTEQEVLIALDKACSPASAYVIDELNQAHHARIKAGGTGFPPHRGVVLNRLRSLERSGKIECRGGPDGYYGYKWRITDAGRVVLATAKTESVVPEQRGSGGQRS